MTNPPLHILSNVRYSIYGNAKTIIINEASMNAFLTTQFSSVISDNACSTKLITKVLEVCGT